MKTCHKYRVIIISGIVVYCLLLLFSGCSNGGGDSSGGSNNDNTDSIIDDSEYIIWTFDLDSGDDVPPNTLYKFNLTTEEYYETGTNMCKIGCQGEINYWNATGEYDQDLETRVSCTDSYTILVGTLSGSECWGYYYSRS